MPNRTGEVGTGVQGVVGVDDRDGAVRVVDQAIADPAQNGSAEGAVAAGCRRRSCTRSRETRRRVLYRRLHAAPAVRTTGWPRRCARACMNRLLRLLDDLSRVRRLRLCEARLQVRHGPADHHWGQSAYSSSDLLIPHDCFVGGPADGGV